MTRIEGWLRGTYSNRPRRPWRTATTRSVAIAVLSAAGACGTPAGTEPLDDASVRLQDVAQRDAAVLDAPATDVASIDDAPAADAAPLPEINLVGLVDPFIGTAAGFVLVESQYRGESDAVGGAIGTITSGGAIEVCRGEVDDTLALMALAQSRCDVDPTRVVMLGGSHGGCIVLEALRRRPAGLRAAVAYVPISDMAELYDYHLAREPGGDAMADGCDPVTTHQSLVTLLQSAMGTPASDPSGYAARSVVNTPGDFAGVAPFMLVYGAIDCSVPIAQPCGFHAALQGAGVSLVNCHLDDAAHATTAPTAACPEIAFEPGTLPAPAAFTGSRYFLLLDGQGHAFDGTGASVAGGAALGFLGAHL